MKPIHTDSFHFQTRGVVPQLPSEAQPPTPSGFRERSNQRVKFILEGHGSEVESLQTLWNSTDVQSPKIIG